MFGVAERGSVMVKSCLINALLCTVLTDGLGSLNKPVDLCSYRRCLNILGHPVLCIAIRWAAGKGMSLAQPSSSLISYGISKSLRK